MDVLFFVTNLLILITLWKMLVDIGKIYAIMRRKVITDNFFKKLLNLLKIYGGTDYGIRSCCKGYRRTH